MTTREFQFSEGSSHKFWRITLDGATHTVQFGRIGTAGQTQTKEFGSEDAAVSAYDKLVAEKVKKGYVELDGEAPSAAPPRPAAAAAAPAKASPPAPPAKAAAPAPPVRAAVEPPQESPPAPSLAADPDAPREIGLEAADWMVATWRPRSPLRRPEPRPFDVQQCAAQLSKLRQVASGWVWDWKTAGIPAVVSREEAQFWLRAIKEQDHKVKPKELAAKLASGRFDGKVTRDQAVRQLKGEIRPESVPLLAAFLSPVELVRESLAADKELRSKKKGSAHGDDNFDAHALREGLQQYVLPYLSDAEVAELREIVRPELTLSLWPGIGAYSYYDLPPVQFFLAALLGAHDELRRLVETWPDDAYAGEEWVDHYHRPQDIIFGLGEARLVELHMRRLKLRLRTPADIRAWLAHTELSALDYARDSILSVTNREEAESLLAAFAVARAPEAAPHILELMLSSKAPKSARAWLDENPAHAAAGLVLLTVGRGRLADAASEFLRTLRRKGGEELIRATIARLPEEIASKARVEILDSGAAPAETFDPASTPSWLAQAAAQATAGKKSSAPAWVTPEDLPAVVVDGRSLNPEQVRVLLGALTQSPLGGSQPLVRELKARGDRPSLDKFAWRLFELWLAEGAPAKEKWAMLALGHLGSDATALRLTPLIRAWPGESQHQRAVTGLEVLRAIGTDTALMQINGIAQKLQFKGLKAKAGECMEGIAQDRGLTRPQLEDRIVPDCELDERGSREFDFGARSFKFVLGPGLKPMIREPDGKVRPDLPKPTAKDDPTLGARAMDEWKLLKKQVAEVAKTQAVRLEQAMVTGRRWQKDEWELLLARHPLMTNLTRLLIWGAYDPSGKLAETFRLTEDLTCADAADELFDLANYPEVGVVHPLHLSDDVKGAWGELLSDYEIVPPFSQLGRPILRLEGAEGTKTDIQRFKSVKIPPQTLVFTLEKLGWQRGIPQDAGIFYSHSKPFYGANVTAVVEYEEGVPVGYMEGWDDQMITRCFFIPGVWKPDMYPDHKNVLRLGEVDPVVISEVLADLTGIAAKGK